MDKKLELLKKELAENPFINLEADRQNFEDEYIPEPTKEEKDLVAERLAKVKSLNDNTVKQPSIGELKLSDEQKERVVLTQKYRAAMFWHVKLSLNGMSERQILEFLQEKNLISEGCTVGHLRRILSNNKDEYDRIFLELFNREYEVELTKGALQAENRLLEIINTGNSSEAEKAARTFLMHFDRARTIDASLSKDLEDSKEKNKKLERNEVYNEVQELLAEANSGIIEMETVNDNVVKK